MAGILSQQMINFHHDTKMWFQKYEDTFRTEMRNIPDNKNIQILLRKLDTAEYEGMPIQSCPKNSADPNFDDLENRRHSLTENTNVYLQETRRELGNFLK
ncbi:hypothetical protein ACTXT7_015585 [Hymenolepis weldensis]